jgi:hypothetical protein
MHDAPFGEADLLGVGVLGAHDVVGLIWVLMVSVYAVFTESVGVGVRWLAFAIGCFV